VGARSKDPPCAARARGPMSATLGFSKVALALALVGAMLFFYSSRGPKDAGWSGYASDVQNLLRQRAVQIPLRHDLGDAHWTVLCESAMAQRYFDQGLRFVVA
jgi:hypothetical protein